MKLIKSELLNVKSFLTSTTVDFSDGLNILVGSNGSGKSNILEIIQGVINTLVLKNININTHDDNYSNKPYAINYPSVDQQMLVNNITDKNSNKLSDEQIIKLWFKIERPDIGRIEQIVSHKEKLINFEREKVANYTGISDLVNLLGGSADYENLVGETFCIKVEGQVSVSCDTIDSPGKPFNHFYEFFCNSNIIAQFLDFYRLESGEYIEFSPYFTYMPPNRPFSFTSEKVITGGSVGGYFYKQSGTHQKQLSASIFDLLCSMISSNALENNERNNQIKKKLENELSLTFSTDVERARYNPKVRIKFSKLDKGIKLSSGEEQLFNLIATLEVHNISSGILIIDEPELHLHPQWQQRMLQILTEWSKELDIQTFFATHSPKLITSDNIGSVYRAYKESGETKIIHPAKKDLEKINSSEIFKIINALNNEKIFFSDKVVLVEGPQDRILYEKSLQITRTDQKEVIEFVECGGKDNDLERLRKLLNLFKIKHFVITDRDYLLRFPEIKSNFQANYKKIKENIFNSRSQDAIALLNSLESILKKRCVSSEDMSELKKLWEYIKLRYISMEGVSFSEAEKKQISDKIANFEKENLFVLKRGSLEDYFGGKPHLTTIQAIKIADNIHDKSNLDPEIIEIMERIFMVDRKDLPPKSRW